MTPTPSETIFADGNLHFSSLLRDIQTAKTAIYLETFIFERDHLGADVIAALADAARRGVEVRVLVDGAGSPLWSTSYAKMLESAGAETKIFHPLPWQLWNWSRSVIKASFLVKGLYLLIKINARNHRKVCLIDHRIAYVGSLNISKCHLTTDRGGDNWRDTSVRLANTRLDPLLNAFDSAWNHRSIPQRLRDVFRQVRKDQTIRLNHTRHHRRILYKHLLRKIRQSQTRIWITNAYFVPDNFLLRRLKEAAKRGVDVRVLLPKKSDVMMMPWASSTFYYSLLKSGIRIFEYLPSMLHAKSLIIDEWMLIGSSNLNHRSLLHDLEADITITTPAAKAQLTQLFLTDVQQARELSLTHWHQQRPWRQRFLGRFVLYLKYWI